MYEALDDFLEVDTWDSFHWADDERFFRALDTIIRDPNFNTRDMAAYIIQKGIDRWGLKPHSETLNAVKDNCVRNAEIIRRYLKALNQC